MYFLRSNSIRVIIAVVGVLGALFAPPWLPLISMGILALRFRPWEVFAIGILVDFLWLPGAFFYPLPLFTIAAIALVWGLEPLRKEILV